MPDEKKDDPSNEKGDKGHDQKEKEENPSQQAGSGGRGGHRKRTGGNPDASN